MSDEHSTNRFGSFLTAELERHDLNLSALATKLGISRASVSRWATGHRLPDPSFCMRIADVLGLDPVVVLAAAGHQPALPAREAQLREQLSATRSEAASYRVRLAELRTTITTIRDEIDALERRHAIHSEALRESRGIAMRAVHLLHVSLTEQGLLADADPRLRDMLHPLATSRAAAQIAEMVEIVRDALNRRIEVIVGEVVSELHTTPMRSVHETQP